MEKEKIYQAINGVMAEIGVIEKNKKNNGQGFMYRGVDDVMNSLQPALIKNKLFIVPEILESKTEERVSKSGGINKYIELKIKYTFYAEDGSNISAVVHGEAMDSGDKGTNKAMSIAFKYACFQVFCIPTEEMIDPDGESPKLDKKSEEKKEKVIKKGTEKVEAKTGKGEVITPEKERKSARKTEIMGLIEGTKLTVKAIQEWCVKAFHIGEISKLTEEQYSYMIEQLKGQLEAGNYAV